MMKNLIKVIIAVSAVLIGLVGVIICVAPAASAECFVVESYVNAVNGCNFQGMMDCYDATIAEMAMTYDTENLPGTGEDALANKIEILSVSGLNVYEQLPGDAKEIVSVELLGMQALPEPEEDAPSKAKKAYGFEDYYGDYADAVEDYMGGMEDYLGDLASDYDESLGNYFDSEYTDVTATVKLTYVNANDETVAVTSVEHFSLIKNANGVKILSV